MYLFKKIIELAITSNIIIILILFMQKILKERISPKISYYFWIILLIKLLIPLNIQSDFSIEKIFYRNYKVQNQDKTSYEGKVTKDKNIEKYTNTNIMLLAKNSYFFIVFILISFGFFLYIKLFKNIRRADEIKDKRTKVILNDCMKILNIKRKIIILESDKINTPSIWGIFKVKILIPRGVFSKLSEADIKYIFLHELSHLKNGDLLIISAMQAVQIIYFFNPLLYLAVKRLKSDCEIACDYTVLINIEENENKCYGRTLINLISLKKYETKISVITGITKNKNDLFRRMKMITKNKKFSFKQKVLGSGIILFLTAISITTYASEPNNLSEKNIDNSMAIEKDKGAEEKIIDTNENIIYKEKLKTKNIESKKIDGEVEYKIKSTDGKTNQELELENNENIHVYINKNPETKIVETITYKNSDEK